jgi:hypothetical protein
VSNTLINAGSITLAGTNSITDSGIYSSNTWVISGAVGAGFSLLARPTTGDLLGTTVTNTCPGPGLSQLDTWAGKNYGVSTNGFLNNQAVGRLILNAAGNTSQFRFKGAGTNNALYVDYLEFAGGLVNGVNNSYDFSQNLTIASNMYIYFADCVVGGVSIAAKVDAASKAGRNGGRLRWVPAYNGHFSSVDIVYPDGTTNTYNEALAGSTTIDSNGNGIANAYDPAPFFTAAQINLAIGMTNLPPQQTVISWNSIPGATNTVYYSTNIAIAPNIVLTNFVSPSLVPPAGGWPITNVIYDVFNPAPMRTYGVKVSPNTTLLYGP